MLVEFSRIFLNVFQGEDVVQLDVDVVQTRRLHVIGLAIDVFEPMAEMPGIQQDNLVVEFLKQIVRPVDEGFVRNRAGNLLIRNEHISRLQSIFDAVQ